MTLQKPYFLCKLYNLYWVQNLDSRWLKQVELLWKRTVFFVAGRACMKLNGLMKTRRPCFKLDGLISYSFNKTRRSEMELNSSGWNWAALFKIRRWRDFECQFYVLWPSSLGTIWPFTFRHFERWFVLKIFERLLSVTWPVRLNLIDRPLLTFYLEMNLHPILFRILAGSSKSDYINTLLMLNI